MGPRLSRGRVHFLSFFKGHSFVRPREHSSVPTAACLCRRAQWPSRMALLQRRRRRLVLDGREHGGTLATSGYGSIMIQGELAMGRTQRAPTLYSVGPSGS